MRARRPATEATPEQPSGRARPTLKDVAELAGVSFKSVSRVVNGEAGVSAAMADRVQAAVDELGYELNHSAHTLRRSDQRIGTIGVVHADITNPFSAAIHAAIEQAASVQDSLLLSGSAGEDPDRQDQLIAAFVARQVDGLIIVPASPEPGPALTRELARNTPIVVVDRALDTAADVVMSDHREGARIATEHLLEQGHRRIGFLGSRERTASLQQRRDGFDDALRTIDGTISTVRTDLTTVARAEAAVHELFADRGAAPTALFAAQNRAAIGTVRALHQLGLHHEIAMVAFDDLEIADIVEPAITTVPQDTAELGRHAAELLFARIAGDDRPPVRRVVPVDLIARGSGEIRAH